MINETIQKAAEILDGQANLARAIGASPAMVHQWINGIRPISVKSCIDIDRATAGAITCEQLRPDLIDRWAYLRGTNKCEADQRAVSVQSQQAA